MQIFPVNPMSIFQERGSQSFWMVASGTGVDDVDMSPKPIASSGQLRLAGIKAEIGGTHGLQEKLEFEFFGFGNIP